MKGINKIYIGDEGKTLLDGRLDDGYEKIGAKQHLQSVLVKRSKSEVTPDRDKVEVGFSMFPLHLASLGYSSGHRTEEAL